MKKNILPYAAALLLCISLLLPQIATAAQSGVFEKEPETQTAFSEPETEPISSEEITEQKTEPETEIPTVQEGTSAVQTEAIPETAEQPQTEQDVSVTVAPQEETETKSALREFLDDPASHIQTAAASPETEALWEEIRASADPFSNADPYMGVLLDHETAVQYGDTAENNGMLFTFVEVVNGKAIVPERIEGSLTEGFMTMQDTIEEKTFAIVEVRRADGAPLTQTDHQTIYFYSRLVSGYKPSDISECLVAEAYLVNLEYEDDFCLHYLIDLSDMLIFADRTLALALTEYMTRLDGDVFIADQNGNYAFREEKISTPHALFYFDLPDSLADPAAVKDYEQTHTIGTNFSKYRK